MGFDFSGFVLRAPRSAPSNSPDTSAPTNGVLRDLKPIPITYDVPAPALIDMAAEQYRTAILNGEDQEEEFLTWAANSSNLAIGEGSQWATTLGSVDIPEGNNTVVDPSSPDNGERTDGSTRLIVLDDGGRTVADVLSITAFRGDDPDTLFTLLPTTHFTVSDPESGVVNILDNGATQAFLNPATGEPASFSALRGDQITEVQFVVASARFWWTRNDKNVTRFGWDGKRQRWTPFRGANPKNLGTLEVGENFELTPRPLNLVVGDFLPGTTVADAYAMIRVGSDPGASSTPIGENIPGPFSGVLVVTDEAVSEDFDFGSVVPTEPAAVVGVTNGVLQFNPAYIADFAGQTVWYIFQSFEEDATGAVGLLLGSDTIPLYIAPIPGPTDRPFIRLGSRRPLIVNLFETEFALPGSVTSGEVAIALSTGRLKFNDGDIAQADPTDLVNFDQQFLGTLVRYDGVALNQQPHPVKDPVELVNSSSVPTVISDTAVLFVPDAVPGPGFGVSGILHVPDDTGALPDVGTPGIRPGDTGLIRQVEGIGDILLYGPSGAIENIIVIDTEDEAPQFDFQIPQGTAYIVRQEGAGGSLVRLGKADRAKFAGEQMLFLQADLVPSVYADNSRIYSRNHEPFVFDGTEVLHFALDTQVITWAASSLSPSGGSFTAEDVATSIQAAITLASNAGSSFASNGRVVLEADAGFVEFGFGNPQDLSAGAVLGFLPGWVLDSGNNWLPDTGVSIGLFRSPVNLDRSNGTADFRSTSRLEDEVLQSPINQIPFLDLTHSPLQDIAGYDENVFFKLVEGLGSRFLDNLDDILYQFEVDRFSWVDSHVESRAVDLPTSTLALGQTNVVPSTLSEGVGGGLFVAEAGGILQRLDLGTDFVLPDNGAPGYALLIEKVQDVKLTGSRAVFTQGGTTFSDLDVAFALVDFSSVEEGDRLKILSGDAAGSYRVVSSTVSQLVVEQEFPVSSTPGPPIAWEVYEGESDADFDPGLIADVQYQVFNHFPTDPFLILLLSALGPVPVDAAAQTPPLGTRLSAVMSDALKKGRNIVVRFGLQGAVENALTGLTTESLGTAANGSLFVPGVGSDRFTDEAFAIRVGADLFEHGGDLVPVGAFSSTIPDDTIEYLTTTGELGFADNVLTDYAEASVHYVEQFFNDFSLIPTGETEYDPQTGDLNFSQADLDEYGSQGAVAYFVEQMITENRLDVAISPLNGAIQFSQPLRAGQIVEVEYFQADSAGDVRLDEDGNPILVREFLPRFIRGEEATRVDDQKYTFNLTGRTIDTRIEGTVYVLPDLQNYGGITEAVVDFDLNTIDFTYQIPDGETVTIGYAVFEAFGGEAAFTVSTPPVFRKPFFLEEGQSSFTLRTDRTVDVSPGKLFRVGVVPFYIKSSAYDASTDLTTVEIFPPPALEAGSRSPGNDAGSVFTDVPVTAVVDPNGDAIAVPEASVGFMSLVAAAFEPIDKASLEFKFVGDLTGSAVEGHLLELDGEPFLISASSFDNATQVTVITVTSPTSRSFDPTSTVVKLSVRPIYDPLPTVFNGLAPVDSSEPFELVLFGETDSTGTELPGRTLVPSIDYQIDFDSGAVTLLEPFQGPLLPGQKLFLRFTKVGLLSPMLKNGVIVLPRYVARFSYVTTPSEENGLLGKIVKATYTFQNPDSFFWRVLPVEEFLGEVSEELLQQVQQQTPHTGAVIAAPAQQENSDQGTVGLIASRQGLIDNDRAARIFVEFYNEVIVGFEQLLETIDGRVIGDRDGKFSFFVGRGKDFTPPGYEDGITGELNPRKVWTEVFKDATKDVAGGPYTFGTDDFVIEPLTASIVSDKLEGRFPASLRLDSLISSQVSLIQNDIDDVVLVGTARAQVVLLSFFKLDLKAKGIFQNLAKPSALSRIYPQTARAFTTTFPGAGADLDNGDPGVYTFGRTVDGPDGPERAKTFRTSIGTVSNPVLGTIENLTSVLPRERLAAARIIQYSDTGFPELDSIIGSTFGTTPRPAIIASAVPLSEFPIDTETGLPDFTQFLSEGGAIKDLLSGDFDLSRPPWVPFADSDPEKTQVGFGRPDGSQVDVGFAGVVLDVQGQSRLGGVYVDEVLSGAVITLRSDTGPILDGGQILVLVSGTALTLEKGDTVQVIEQTGTDVEPSDPPTNEELQALARNLPNFRVGFDLGVNTKDGEYIDLTYPSFEDPTFLGIKELFGQKPPLPLSTVEAFVTFSNGDTEPLRIPALEGEALDDDGDEAVPYLSTTNTETALLGSIQGGMTKVITTDTFVPTAQYPDEILGDDGEVLALATTDPPATLITQFDVTPVATAGPYVPHSGIGDVGPYDLLLVETGSPPPVAGSQGILTVGAATGGVPSYIEPPRFVTQSKSGSRCRYTFQGAMTHASQTGTTGMVVSESGGNTLFDISTVSNLFFNDGQPGTAGGLNNVVSSGTFPFPNDNQVVITIIDRVTGLVAEQVNIKGNQIVAGAGSPVIGSAPTFDQTLITIPATGFFNFPALGAVAPGPTAAFDFYIRLDLHDSLNVPTSGSTGAFVESDRLTFTEELDFRSVRESGAAITGTSGSFVIEGRLEVNLVEGPVTDLMTVNDRNSVNGGSTFTFESRPSISGFGIGTFTPATGSGVGDEAGSVKVMGWEGYGNTPLPATDIPFSAVPSTIFDETSNICFGTGDCDPTIDNQIRNISIVLGGLNRIEKSDLVVIDRASGASHLATAKAGTCLVRHTIFDANTVVNEQIGAGDGGTLFFGSIQLVEDVIPGPPAPPGVTGVTVTATIGGSPSVMVDDGIGGLSGPDGTGLIVYNLGALALTYTTAPDANTPILITYETIHRVSSLNAVAGSSGWVEVAFPEVVDFNDTAQTLEVSTLLSVPDSTNGTAFPGTGRVYVVVDQAALTSSDPDVAKLAVVSADYGALNIGATRFDSLSNYRDADNNVLTVSDFNGLVGAGMSVSGMQFFNVRVRGLGLADNNNVGNNLGGIAGSGVRNVEIANSSTTGSVPFLEQNLQIKIDPQVPAAGDLLFKNWALPTPGTFLSDENAGVYDDVLSSLDISNITSVQWDALHNVSGNTTLVECLLPAESFQGLYVPIEGVYLEPSFPTSVFDLDSGSAHVVDAGHSLTASEVGFRTGPGLENVEFTVRRIRRWHEVQEDVSTDLSKLAFAYEIRRGTITGLASLPNQMQRVTASAGTQLGPFDDPDVNINPGDLFKHFDPSGNFVQEVEVATVEDGTNLVLVAPGLQGTITGGHTFEIYLRQAPVPHEQSNEQLFALITDEVLLQTDPVYSTQTGGFVDNFNELQDTNVDGISTLYGEGGLGVQPGDYVVVDPAGAVEGSGGPTTPQETGFRPFGDQSVMGRTSFVAGKPSELDDNRGFYRVNQVNDDNLVITEPSVFAGVDEGASDDVVFGSVSKEYAVYPTVSNSSLTVGNREGQMSLRPTALAAGSFQGNDFSIAPFGYRIIRPTTLLQQETVELILMHRERILSWVEHLGTLTLGLKSGSYFVFQRDQHMADLGDPLIPDDGLGLLSNAVIQGLLGLTFTSPFESDSDALSVLDRRFWIGDVRLDSENPPFTALPPYADFQNGEGRPVLPDLIEESLDRTDQVRELRFAWIDYRANRIDGTLIQIENFDRTLPRNLEEQRRLAKLTKGFS